MRRGKSKSDEARGASNKVTSDRVIRPIRWRTQRTRSDRVTSRAIKN